MLCSHLVTFWALNIMFYQRTLLKTSAKSYNNIQLMTFHKVDTVMYQPRGSVVHPKPTAEVNITSKGLINQCPPK
jgi:hypothetical protein